MINFEWTGVFPAVTTKFGPDDELDLVAFDKNIAAQLEAGAEGIILGGSLGEASVLTEEEKFTLLKHTLALVEGKVPVILNIAEQTTKAAIAFAKKAYEYGADGLMLLPPMRYKADELETVTFFKEVAKSTPLPIMIYNNPVDYKIEVTLDMFEQLAEVENIQAVKESTRDVINVTRMFNRFGNRFKIFTGVDPIATESLMMGADGWVAGLVDAFPRETVAIYRLVKAGRYDEARAIHRWFLPLLELDIHPKLVQYIKLAEVATGIGTERVRAPRLPLSGEERERVQKVIADALAVRPELPEGSWGKLETAAY
ncbi:MULTISPECIES: dihydrodipicolinate synthase family protein [unclassified Mucilaginibacter]|uniref:dihydrodipicolinate synthase family protein n=1 Tax=unclassified Mucilaginibacter TaxID=2617802 RepID=UPI000966741D|nr:MULTISPECIES: dihydrodipicolinate synthase family protein [unclassified Mucilaginibacter]OJW13313.1 MAG: dihydrodipicolinate synthase family protein [Mucilaginibacter sp. 44-25]PLW88295.1 MAG: dihydrodipicolinate synthase family protein [Mucilaginibacter sp.]